MQPPTRDATDIGGVEILVNASNSDTNKDVTRQEFAQEADINYMLSRFGVTAPRGSPTYGEWDDTIELQTALNSVREAEDGYYQLPKELREKFPSMEDFLTAVDNGSLKILKDEEPAKEVPPEQK